MGFEGCTVDEGSIVLYCGQLLVLIRTSSELVVGSATSYLAQSRRAPVVDCTYHVASACWACSMGRVRAGALAYAQYRCDAVRSCAVMPDQVHVEALAYGRCPCAAARLSALATGLDHAEVPVVDQDVEESPSPAWVVGKAVVPYWPDP